MQTPIREPIELAAGDTLTFRKDLADYHASDGWSLKYELRGSGPAIEFVSAASGDAHLVTVQEDVTVTWLTDDYVLVGYAVNATSGDRHQIYYGPFKLTPNLEASAGDIDVRTHATKMLAKIEAVLEGRADDDVLNSQIEGTRIDRIPVPDLLLLRDRYKAETNRELAAARVKAGLGSGRKILTRFRRPG